MTPLTLPRFFLKEQFTASSFPGSPLSHRVTGLQQPLQLLVTHSLFAHIVILVATWLIIERHGELLTFTLFFFFSLSYFLTLDLVSPNWSPRFSLSFSRSSRSLAAVSASSEKIEAISPVLSPRGYPSLI